jgi:putative heme-binding domain-containing protein
MFDHPLERTRTVDVRPTQGAFGIPEPAIIRAGDPSRSVLLYRLATLGAGRMPRLGSREVDERGLALLEEWVRGLPPVDRAAPSVKDESFLDARAAAAALAAGGGGGGGGGNGALGALGDRLLRSTGGALMLARALGRGEVPAGPARDALVEKGAANERPEIRGLFERFLPEDKRVPRLGEAIDPAQILALKGEPERGRKIFEGAAGCIACHRAAGDKGGLLGPDLAKLATRLERDKILESLIDPSKQIDPKFAGFSLETADGETIMGVLIERTPQGVTIVDARNAPLKVEQARIKRLLPQDKSLMPEGLLGALTAQEAADLLAFLSGLR